MYICNRCKEETAKFNMTNKTMECSKCGCAEVVAPAKETCYNCGYQYNSYILGVPSGCSKCHASFVD